MNLILSENDKKQLRKLIDLAFYIECHAKFNMSRHARADLYDIINEIDALIARLEEQQGFRYKPNNIIRIAYAQAVGYQDFIDVSVAEAWNSKQQPGNQKSLSHITKRTAGDEGVSFAIADTFILAPHGGANQYLAFLRLALSVATSIYGQVKGHSENDHIIKRVLTNPATPLRCGTVILTVMAVGYFLGGHTLEAIFSLSVALGDYTLSGVHDSIRNFAQKAGAAGKALIMPEIYYTTGLVLAALIAGPEAIAMLPVLIYAGVMSIWNSFKADGSNFGRPMLAFAAATFITGTIGFSLAENYRETMAAIGNFIFSMTYVKIAADREDGFGQMLSNIRYEAKAFQEGLMNSFYRVFF